MVRAVVWQVLPGLGVVGGQWVNRSALQPQLFTLAGLDRRPDRFEHRFMPNYTQVDQVAGIVVGIAGDVSRAVFVADLRDAFRPQPINLTADLFQPPGHEGLTALRQGCIDLLALSWTLAAVGEELAYRGYLQKVLGDLFGGNLTAVLLTVIISSVVFGLAYTEQGIIGVVVTTIDALVFSWLKLKYNNNLWAAILAHGFYNSIGVFTFYFTGPIYGLW